MALFYEVDTGGHIRDPHIGAIGVGDRPKRLTDIESLIVGRVVDEALIREVGALATQTVNPDDDIHAPGEYRRALVGVLTERALAQSAGFNRKTSA